jgi:hypothetical protein
MSQQNCCGTLQELLQMTVVAHETIHLDSLVRPINYFFEIAAGLTPSADFCSESIAFASSS